MKVTPKKIRAVMTHLSSLGASKGGLARAASLTPEERSAIARRAAQARWERVRETQRQEYAEAQRVAEELVAKS